MGKWQPTPLIEDHRGTIQEELIYFVLRIEGKLNKERDILHQRNINKYGFYFKDFEVLEDFGEVNKGKIDNGHKFRIAVEGVYADFDKEKFEFINKYDRWEFNILIRGYDVFLVS